jgi:hypothetical protein
LKVGKSLRRLLLLGRARWRLREGGDLGRRRRRGDEVEFPVA